MFYFEDVLDNVTHLILKELDEFVFYKGAYIPSDEWKTAEERSK